MQRPYRFWRDPLWLCACVAYLANRFILVRLIPSTFLRGHFNDLWLLPAALPIVLHLQSLLGLRARKAPSKAEVAVHWLFWSLIAEAIAPLVFTQSTGDWKDSLAYGIGAIAGAAWWSRNELTNA